MTRTFRQLNADVTKIQIKFTLVKKQFILPIQFSGGILLNYHAGIPEIAWYSSSQFIQFNLW